MCLTAPRRSVRHLSQKHTANYSFPVPEVDDVIPPLPDPKAVPQEERIALAIEAVNASMPASGGKPKLSLRQAAKAYGIPRTTLTDRYNGVGTRQEAHAFQQLLSVAQERILADWVKVQARRGVPISPTSLADHASDIAGQPVGTSWQGRFMERHPDLKTRWTQSLEQCRANNVNRPTVYKFFDILEELVKEFNIPVENIYNMDEKGVQLGVGKRVAAIVDRSQKNVYNLENGNRELVTIIETVCADGSALHPTVIFEGKRVNLGWTKNNPCHASVACSPNGWTDQDLGAKWLERDFEPMSAARNKTGGYRLLILDGHNSHSTYQFCKFAKEHNIIIICLPSHTTHVLQPCDVGVFGPLASSWKAQVNQAARNYMPITKYNLLEQYSAARERAFKDETIRSAFEKTGIWPMNRHALDPHVFDPSLNTTTQAAQPLPTTLPSPDLVTITATTSTEATTLSHVSNSSNGTVDGPAILTLDSQAPPDGKGDLPKLSLKVPKPLKGTASRQELQDQNKELFRLLKLAEEQIQRDHAQKRLMDRENERLRQRLHWKQKKKEDKRTTAEARHLTADEALDQGAQALWRVKIKEFHELAKPIFKKQREDINEYYRNLVVQEKMRADEEKRRAAQEKKAQEAAEKEEAVWRREMANVAKYAEEYEAAVQKQVLREEKKKKAAKAKASKAKASKASKAKASKASKAKVVKGKGKRIEPSSEDSGEFEDDHAVEEEESAAEKTVEGQEEERRPVPRPRPIRRQPAPEEQAVDAETEEVEAAEPVPSTSTLLVNMSVLGTAGVASTSSEPTAGPRYTLRSRRGR